MAIKTVTVNGTTYDIADELVMQTISTETSNRLHPILASPLTYGTMVDGTSTAIVKPNVGIVPNQSKIQIYAGTYSTTGGSGSGYALYDFDNSKQLGSFQAGTQGTTTTLGQVQITLGNATEQGTAGNARGTLYLYGSSDRYSRIISAAESSSKTNTLPNASGYLAVGSTSGVGSATTPIYMDSTGELKACSGDIGSDTKVTQTVTLNSSSYPILFGSTSGATTTGDRTSRFNENIVVLANGGLVVGSTSTNRAGIYAKRDGVDASDPGGQISIQCATSNNQGLYITNNSYNGDSTSKWLIRAVGTESKWRAHIDLPIVLSSGAASNYGGYSTSIPSTTTNVVAGQVMFVLQD